MDLFVVLRDGLDVAIPSILSSQLPEPLLTESTIGVLILEASGKGVVSILLKGSISAVLIVSAAASWASGHLIPLGSGGSQERNGICELLSVVNLWMHLVFV